MVRFKETDVTIWYVLIARFRFGFGGGRLRYGAPRLY